MPLILLIVGIALIIYSYRSIKKENKLNESNESLRVSFSSVMKEKKEDVNDYKMELGLLRKDMAESLTELQEEILDIKNNLNKLKNNKIIYENKENLEKDYFLEKSDGDHSFSNTNVDEMDSRELTKDKDNRVVEYLTNENQFLDLKLKEEEKYEVDFLEDEDSNKTQKIKKLLKEGLTEEEICHKLSVSKGEVLLVKGLYKK